MLRWVEEENCRSRVVERKGQEGYLFCYGPACNLGDCETAQHSPTLSAALPAFWALQSLPASTSSAAPEP